MLKAKRFYFYFNNLFCKLKKIPVIICNKIVIPNKKPRFQKEFMIKGQGYDSKWDFITNTKCKFINELSLMFIIDYVLAFYYSFFIN